MSSTRTRVRDDDVMRVANRLTERDREILRLLSHHRVFTTEQLTEVFFTNPTTARHRLTELHRLRLVDRFKPRRWLNDCAPYHYVLGQMGAMVVAAERDEDLDKLRWRADKALAIGSSQRLNHLVGVNGFFTGLIAESRQKPGAHLVEWWSERQCDEWYGTLVRPDGLGVWREDGVGLDFFLEYDRGTETLERVADKLEGYEKLEAASAESSWILFRLRSVRREAGIRRVLAGVTVPVATAAPAAGQRPHEAIWLPLGKSGPRRRLIELAHAPKPAESIGRVRKALEERRRDEERSRELEELRASRGW
jgi:predicted transcriptional regulator